MLVYTHIKFDLDQFLKGMNQFKSFPEINKSNPSYLDHSQNDFNHILIPFLTYLFKTSQNHFYEGFEKGSLSEAKDFERSEKSRYEFTNLLMV